MDFTQPEGDNTTSEDVTFDDEEEWTQLIQTLSTAGQQRRQQARETRVDYILGEPKTVRVKFPKTAYRSQEILMHSMITGVQKSENCLLESPTGTGKTLAILCSLLAWQQNCKHKSDWGHTIDEATLKIGCTCGFMQGDPTTFTILQNLWKNEVVLERYTFEFVEEEAPTTGLDDSNISPKKQKVEVQRRKENPDVTKGEKDLCRFCIRSNYKESRVPVIYYATRTISQVEQVVNQLKITEYSGIKMTVLAGRSTYCTNLDVAKPYLSVDDECHKLRENYSRNQLLKKRNKIPYHEECRYYQGGTYGANKSIYKNFGKIHEAAWDIEELKAFSRCEAGCPYYGSKILLEHADIVFCTYNYLLNEDIRKISNISLINNVLVFDEAHNIEDQCRAIASLDIKQNYINGPVCQAFATTLAHVDNIPKGMPPIIDSFLTVFRNFSNWFDMHSETIIFNPTIKNEEYKVFGRDQIISEFNKIGFSDVSIYMLYGNVKTMEESIKGTITENTNNATINNSDDSVNIQNDTTNSTTGPRTRAARARAAMNLNSTNATKTNEETEVRLKFPMSIIRYLKNLFVKLRKIFGIEETFEDYGIVFIKKVDSIDRLTKKPTYSNEFRLICLNPAITFKQLRNSCHTVIVTSGTLAPLDSFESELDTPFNIKTSAPHVIKPTQVLPAVVTNGPKNIELCFNKGGQQILDSQDELGRAILSICKIVPHGVLVFFPSYRWLEQLKSRWTNFPHGFPLLKQLQSVKKLYFEDSKKSKEEFKNDMENFRRDIIESTEGCLLFAVFRGKISEGVDFKDNQARAVLTVGIPFSNPTDVQISLKMEYNNTMKRKKMSNVLSGDLWYKTQAFRAMNQAFGRCVRHEKDWGSLILLDSRMRFPINTSFLSKWVSKDLRCYTFRPLEDTLRKFVNERKNEDEYTQVNVQNVAEMETLLIDPSEILTDVINPAIAGSSSAAQLQLHSNTEDLLCPSPDKQDNHSHNSSFLSVDYESSSNEELGPTSGESDIDEPDSSRTQSSAPTQRL